MGRRVQPAIVFGFGLVFGLFIFAVLRLVIQPAVPEVGIRLAAAGELSVWRRLLVIYVAAVGEELVFRLLLLSFVAGLAARLVRRGGPVPDGYIVWAATGVSAVAFAAAHVPIWLASVPLSFGLILAVVSMNALGGVVFGTVFVRHGIAAAVLAHAGADCATQLIGPVTM
jgi:hypothetical protein